MSSDSEFWAWGKLVLLSIIWGTSFILIKKALISFAPLEVALLRVGISGIAFLPLFFYYFKRLEWSRWYFYLLVALTGSGIPAVLYATAQTKLSSATTGILNSITPIATLLVSILIFKIASSTRQVIGTLLALLGAIILILMGTDGAGFDMAHLGYAMLIIIGCILYAGNVNMVKIYLQHVPSRQLSTFAFVLLGVPLMFLVPFTDIPRKIMEDEHAMSSLGALVLLALLGTVFSLILFYQLLQQTSAVFASTVAYLIPIVALIWGFLDGEYIGLVHVISLGIIIFGVYLIRDKKLAARNLASISKI